MSDKIKISGIAVSEQVSRNGRKYIAKELEKFAPTLTGRPILKDHEGITDNVIGVITHAETLDAGKTVRYEGWVKEDGSGIVEKMKDGRIKEVSIGAMAGKVVKENKDDPYVIPVDMEAMELSTTPVPGNRGTSIIKQDENNDLSEDKLKDMIESYESNLNINKKEENMESKQTQETESTIVDNSKELSELKEQMEA